ncbi:hypothetical protein JAO73_09070 [Hymenobacter sp. BT523]|uniref:hypothetical protein n=1 Tax=Hymenobacter sp. BT523 TaxID=2795725 RepID=UPI0018ECDD01|nr:hypothetical protein [Hymenobacter sp. BT523]MBJ6109160.1 hypothetical protein [Hymenobacter sp. BT523]
MNKGSLLLASCLVVAVGTVGAMLFRGQAQQAMALEKIAALEVRLAANNQQGAQAMANTVYGIRVAVAQNQSQARDVAVLTQSQQLLVRTKSLVDTLHLFQQALRAAAHEDPTGALRHPDAVSGLNSAITPQRLARHLDRYTAFIRPCLPGAPAFTLTGPDGTTWLYPPRVPLAAALASLTRLEAQVRRLATDALNQQAQKVGTHCGFDKIGAMAVAASNTAAPGATYEAQLFLTMAASSLRPVMRVEGKEIEVHPNGWGAVEINVPLPRPGQPDTVRARWHGTVLVKSALGDTAFQVDAPYLVVKQPTQ